MLAIKQAASEQKTFTVNVLPCRLQHDGPTKVTKRYWSPTQEPDNTHTTYFRGRRLKARRIVVPDDYQGLVWQATSKTIPPVMQRLPENPTDDETDETGEPIKIVEQVGTFQDLMVWGHDQVPAKDDVFVKGIEEWISFAEAIHGPAIPFPAEQDHK